MPIDEEQFDALLRDIDRSRRPGIAVGVALHGRPVYRKAFGLANLELPVVLSPTMRMRIGSITKQFTAFAYMLLCDEGLASIDDAIGVHIPEVHSNVRPVTMRQLMGNNSGLRDALDLCRQFNGSDQGPIATHDVLSFYMDRSEVNSPPGIAYLYNNGGWYLVGAAIERITGRPLEEVLLHRVFEPIGMHDTLLRRWEGECVANSATAYVIGNGGRYERPESTGGLDWSGAGGIASTVDDMLKWLAHMSQPTVGSARTWQLMTTPQRLANGISTSYGLGLSNMRVRGIEVIRHNGGVLGWNSQMTKVPSANLDIIVLSNCREVSASAYEEKILELCVPGLDPRTPDVAYESEFPTGVFRSPTTGRVIALGSRDVEYYRGGTAVPAAAIDGHYYPVAPDASGVLRPCREVFGEFAITPIGDFMNPRALHFLSFGTADEFVSMSGDDASSRAEIIEGRYWSHEAEAAATVQRGANGLEVRFKGRFGSAVQDLEHLAGGVWHTKMRDRWVLPKWGLLVFDDPKCFGFSNTFNKNVRFARQ